MADSAPSLTLRTIATTAIALADSDGLGTVSMRRVAGALGVSAMALYRYVDDRDALLIEMARLVAQGFPVLPDGNATWRETLTHMAAADWDSFMAHPWLLEVVMTPDRLLTLASRDDLETILSRLHATGLPANECLDALLGMSGLAIGVASLAFTANPPYATSPMRTPPLGGADAARGQDPAVGLDAFGGQDPVSAAHPLAEQLAERGITRGTTRAALRFSVECFLDGVQARVLRAAHTTEPSKEDS